MLVSKRTRLQTALVCALAVLMGHTLAQSTGRPALVDARVLRSAIPRLIVKIKQEKLHHGNQAAALDVGELTAKATGFGAPRVTSLLPFSTPAKGGLGAAGGPSHPGSQVFVFDFSDSMNVDSIRLLLEAQPWVEYAEYDRLMELYATPNDPLLSWQWALANTGQLIPTVDRLPGFYNDTLAWVQGTPGADVGFLAAWNHPGPRARVIVGILDTGVDPHHEDLAGHLWHNPGEIPDNGIDDDHNGYIDDDLGYDFSGNDAQFPNTIVPDADPTDTIGHGTHVAGIVTAVTNNAVGICGVAPDARIMTLKVFPNAFNSVVARAIYYGVDNGAEMFNLSFGSPFPSKTVADALAYARSRGVLPVAAAGNSGAEDTNYPAADTAVLCVGAADYHGQVTSFSTYGNFLDVVAPGLAILSLRASGTDMYAENGEPDVHIIAEKYYLADGTSMASPYAAGCAAAVMSLEAGLTPEQVIGVLARSCVDLVDPYGTGASYPGWDKYSGYGLVNLDRALAELAGVTVHLDTPHEGEVRSGTVAITGTAAGSAFTGYDLVYGWGTSPSSWTTLRSSTQPVIGDTLLVWNTSGLTGTVTLRLQAAAQHDQLTFLLANRAISKITSPEQGDTISLVRTVIGSTVAPDYISSTVAFAPQNDPENITTAWTGTRPVVDDSICAWTVDAKQNGWYDLKLITTTQSGTLVDSVLVYIKNPFHPGWPVRIPAYAFYAPAAADLDADGKAEFVVPTSRGLYVFKADGTLAPGWPRDTLINFQSIPAITDLDQDGHAEVIIPADGYLRVYDYTGAKFGSPYSLWPRQFTGISSLWGYAVPTVCVLDSLPDLYSRNGIPKILVINIDGTVYIYDYYGREAKLAKSYVRPQVDVTNSAGAGLPQATVIDADCPYGSGPDGQNELIVAADGVWVFDAWTGKPFGGDGQNPRLRVYHSTYGMAVGNFDTDRALEIAVLYLPSGSHIWHLDVMNLDGTSLPGWPVSTGVSDDLYLVNSISIGDIDGDDLPEIFLAPYFIGKSYVLAFRADGTPFIPRNPDGKFIEFGTASSPVMLTDVTGDGHPEIMIKTGDFFMGDEYLYAMTADGEFAPGFPLRYGYGTGAQLPTPLALDLDGDGFLNLLTLESSGRVATAIDLPCRATTRGHPWPRLRHDNWNSGVLSMTPDYGVVYVVKLVNYMFRNNAMYFPPYEIPDADCDGRLSIADLVVIVNFVYRSGPLPCTP